MEQAWNDARPQAPPQPRINRIGVSDVTESLRLGWADFKNAPTQIVFLCLIYPIVGFVLGSAAAGGEMLPLVYPLLAGFALLGPLAALGIYELSRRQEQGLPVSWTNMFGVLRSPAIFSIAALAVGLVLIFLLWLTVARGLFHLIMGPDLPADFGAMVSQVLGTSRGMTLILLGNVIGAGFALAVLAMSVVSFPMLLDRDVTPAEAVRTSLAAFRANPVTLILWGIIVAMTLAVGMALLFVGLAVALPVLGHATWHLYRRLVT